MELVRRGYDAWQISKIMNHSDVKITEHYIKMLDKDIAGAYYPDKGGKKKGDKALLRGT
jgi:integrase